MVINGRHGHQLVKETPFTLLALTRHEIEPHEEAWFARCRADYLRSFPLSLLELVRLSLLLALVGPLASPMFTICAVLCSSALLAMQAASLASERKEGLDQKIALRNRARTIAIRGALWSALLIWAFTIAPHHNLEGLLALGLAMMAVDGISVLALPHIALAVSLGGGLAVSCGMALREGPMAAGIASILALVLASFMHWSIYNLYYLFATRRIRTRRLSQSNETVQLLLNQYDDEGSDWLYEIDRDGRLHNPSTRFAEASGLSIDQLEGMPIAHLIEAGDSRDMLCRKFEECHSFRNHVVSVRVRGEERWWSVSGRPVEKSADGNAASWRGFIADVSAAKRAEAKVAFMAHYDLLTQLPNRTLFNATLERAFTRMAPDDTICLLYIDLDHFKQINDGYGHATGDQVLAEVARRLEANLRPRDMVARLGGDEFVVIMPTLDCIDHGLSVAERLLEDISRPVDIDGQIMPVGASIGMAFAPHDADNAQDLLRAADLAMYNAKSRGRRGISLFEAEMEEHMRNRRELELDLRASMARDQLELHYQPLINLQTGNTTGYEALLRWNHTERGMVSPATFIPIAEETGLIIEIGEWVIRNALAEAATWPDHLTVAVNLSPAQMRSAGIVSVVVNALATNKVNPARLELEITENLLMQESSEVLTILHSLRDIGVRIALDDFGTGYSSLNYLRSFPFDKIKIDRCFISDLSKREDCQAIVRSVIALANELNMTTTAEGVEGVEELEALMRNGCDQVQGFYYSRALPVADLHFGDVAKKRALTKTADDSPGEIAPLSLPISAAPADPASPMKRKRA